MKHRRGLNLKETICGGGEKAVAMDAAFSVIMSFIAVFNKNAIVDHLFFNRYDVPRYAFLFLLYMALFFIATRIIAMCFLHEAKKDVVSNERKSPHFMAALAMFAAWIPYLLGFLPGVANYDTVNQVNDFFDGVSPVPFGFVKGQETVNVFLNAHHPIVPTFIFSFFVAAGALLGSETLGFLLYILCQMLLGAFLISEILCFLHENAADSRSRLIIKSVRVFFMFMPFVPMYMICMLKNTMHSLLFILYIFVLYRYYLGKDDKPAKSWIVFFIIVLLLCTTLNTGVFVTLFTGIASLFIRKKDSRILLISVLCAVIWFIVFPKLLYPALNVFPGGKQELYGTLFHQTARLIRDNEEEFTKEDKQIIDAVLDYEKIKENFSFDATDPVKDTFRLHSTDEDMRKYLGLWLRMGIKHPIVYLRATFSICGNFFAPGAGIQIFGDIPQSEGMFGKIHAITPRVFGDKAFSLYYNVTITPFIRLIFQTVIYAFWIPVYLLYVLVIRKKMLGTYESRPEMIILVPLFVSALFLIVSPMNYSRYALCLIFASPIAIALLCTENKKS
ncbi:DUF6020 family protein [Butyrivibrio sp. AE3004]|uniref:DUF6020 family protein n=1 Tax=Butyrivibrio sp. AE3004 TaxID=1506994 RepID=UPI0004940ACD|nr:DUF6020 family protein [Butyrivibrio sp. AE3004]